MKGTPQLWDVWKVYYMTYDEIDEFGDKERELVASGLSFAQAQRKVDELGRGPMYGHSMWPAQA